MCGWVASSRDIDIAIEALISSLEGFPPVGAEINLLCICGTPFFFTPCYPFGNANYSKFAAKI